MNDRSSVLSVILDGYPNKQTVIDEIVKLKRGYPSFEPFDSTLESEDGTSSIVIGLRTTLVIEDENKIVKSQQVPIQIWLPRRFPFSPPEAKIQRPPGLMFNKNHPNIRESDGKLKDFNTLISWGSSPSLINFVDEVVKLFGIIPPFEYNNQPSATNTSTALPPPPKYEKSSKKILEEILQEKLNNFKQQLKSDTDNLQSTNAKLKDNNQYLNTLITHLEKDIGNLNNNLSIVERLSAQLAAIEVKGNIEEVPIDERLLPRDALSKQLLETVVEDAAIEDTIYALQEALEASIVDSESFIKQVRLYSRQQFMCRALAKKISSVL